MSELERAHTRIRELEDRIAGRDPARPPAWRRAVMVVAYLLTLVGIAVASGTAILPRRDQVLVGAEAPPPPGIAAGALDWRAGPVFRDHGPLLVDVNGDGVEDVVGLAWRHQQDEAALHVVAFDRKTYAVLWRSGPFPARWRDEAVHIATTAESSLVVTDGAGTSHFLDRATGVESMHLPTPASSPPEPPSCPRDRTLPCTETSSDATGARVDAVLHQRGFAYDLVAGTERISLGSVFGPEAQRETHALRWDAAGKLLFNVALIPKGRENRVSFSPNEWTVLGTGRFLHLYESAARQYRLAMRSSTTGQLAYDVAVPALHDGSVIGAMTTDGDELFVVADESLLVLDARSGAITHRLHRF